jgi:oxygen-independent coproporphyrinogen-3 oxidase
MVAEKSRDMVAKSFRRTRYRFAPIPHPRFSQSFGIYVHVPFCFSFCAFCPFYKEKFSHDAKRRYVDALCTEIGDKPIAEKPVWIYFGGGTPNTLTLEDLERILASFRKKCALPRTGIELHPASLAEDYVHGLADIGITKISVGIESMSADTLACANRPASGLPLDRIMSIARTRHIWTNTDLMIGLPGQDQQSFFSDIQSLITLAPSQITIYPFMRIGSVTAASSMSNHEQYRHIERAAALLCNAGYERSGIWTFARGNDIYDSSRDELITDYAGYGPGAFSTYGDWKVVNPEMKVYCDMIESGNRRGFIAPKTEASDQWRRFARMIYDIRCKPDASFPWYINAYIRLLRCAGYASWTGRLSAKGLLFAHDITKTVVESLPYPLQNPSIIDNYADYQREKVGTPSACTQ